MGVLRISGYNFKNKNITKNLNNFENKIYKCNRKCNRWQLKYQCKFAGLFGGNYNDGRTHSRKRIQILYYMCGQAGEQRNQWELL